MRAPYFGWFVCCSLSSSAVLLCSLLSTTFLQMDKYDVIPASMGLPGGWYQPHSHIASPAFHSSASLSPSITSSTWFLDSGASNHMTFVEHSFTDSNPYLGKEKNYHC